MLGTWEPRQRARARITMLGNNEQPTSDNAERLFTRHCPPSLRISYTSDRFAKTRADRLQRSEAVKGQGILGDTIVSRRGLKG